MDASWGERRQGEVLALVQPLVFAGGDGSVSEVLIVSQTCDVVQPSRDLVLLAPIEACDRSEFELASRGKSSYKVAIGQSCGDYRVARLDRITAFAKAEVLGTSKMVLHGDSDSSAESRALALTIGRYFSRFPVPDEARKSFVGLIDRLRRDMDKPNRRRVLDDILELRVAARPSWDADRFAVQITVIARAASLPSQASSGTCGPGDGDSDRDGVFPQALADVYAALASEGRPDVREVLWERFAECLQELTCGHGPVTEVDVEVLSEDDYKYSDWLRSESLNLEALSPVAQVTENRCASPVGGEVGSSRGATAVESQPGTGQIPPHA